MGIGPAKMIQNGDLTGLNSKKWGFTAGQVCWCLKKSRLTIWRICHANGWEKEFIWAVFKASVDWWLCVCGYTIRYNLYMCIYIYIYMYTMYIEIGYYIYTCVYNIYIYIYHNPFWVISTNQYKEMTFRVLKTCSTRPWTWWPSAIGRLPQCYARNGRSASSTSDLENLEDLVPGFAGKVYRKSWSLSLNLMVKMVKWSNG